MSPEQRSYVRAHAERLGQIAELDTARHLTRADATTLERAYAYAALARAAQAQAEKWAQLARVDGASYADLADALDMSRQGTRKKFGHLEVVS